MNFERRGFLRVGVAGLAGTVLNLESALAQVQPQDQSKVQPQHKPEGEQKFPGAEFRGGSGSLSLRLELSSGKLNVEIDNFNRGLDKAFIMDGSFEPANQTPDKPKVRNRLYRSYFCADDANQVFARLGDGHAWTSLLVSRTGDSNIYSLTVWDNGQLPESFSLDKSKFGSDPQNPQNYIVGGKGTDLIRKLTGGRKPPLITADELEDALYNVPDYLRFVRGKSLLRKHASPAEFACVFIVFAVPGGAMFVVDWDAF